MFDKYIIAALLGSLFFAFELVISKQILPYYSSITFYFLRCLLMFLITLIIFKPKTKIKNNTKILTLIAGAILVLVDNISNRDGFIKGYRQGTESVGEKKD